MSPSADTLQRVVSFLANALCPFAASLGSDDEVLSFLEELGWSLPVVPPSIAALAAGADAMVDALADVETASAALAEGAGDEDALRQALVELVVRLTTFALQTQELRTKLPQELPPDALAATGIADAFQRRLFEDLVVRAVRDSAPLSTALAGLVGIVEEFDVAADPTHLQPDYTHRALRLDRIGTLLNDPKALLREVYGWGTSALDLDRLFTNLERVSYPLLGPIEVRFPSDALLASTAPGAPISEDDGPPPAYTIPIYEGGPITLVLAVLPLPQVTPQEPQGVAITLMLGLGADANVAIAPMLTLALDGTLDLASGVAAILRPDRDPELVLDPEGAAPPMSGKGGARLTFGDPDEGPTRLLTVPGGSSFEANEIHFSAGVDATSGVPDVYMRAGVVGGTLKIAAGDADSFLSSILPTDGLTANVDVGVEWSQRGGLRFTGAAGLEATIPVHAEIGPFTIQSAYVGVKGDGDGVSLELSATGGAAIGPIHASVSRLGFILRSAFHDGNLGPIDLALGFKPPSGIGLSVDVAGIVGGGFIEHDPAKHQYAGMVQLGFYSYKLLAFGLLTTVLPTGPGYSLVVMVDAEFPPIQLGFGFTLAGAGGMLGIHRTASIDALRVALSAHTLSNLLFPKHPIENAPQLLTELDTLFPAADGRFVFGPLARIAWGSPPLLTLDLALILELPAPVRLILISELTVVLPKPDAVLVEIHLTALGTIDFGKGEAGLDAVLHDSRLVKFVLHGSMALRVCWSGQKTFLLAVGGAHPKFQLPPGFPKLDRLGISLASGSIAKLNLEGYMAISSNTLQIGAHVDLFVGIDGFAISGVLTFDTLIQRHPFHFDGDISGAVSLSVAGNDIMALKLSASLNGPAPWHAAGSVTFDVLWWSVTKSFSKTFGDHGITEVLDAIDVGQLLREALADPRSFAASLAADVSALVTLTAPVTAATTCVAHPGAGLSVHQTVVPLGLTITQYGGAVPAGEMRFEITSVLAGGIAQPSPSPVLDDFAPAQFLTLGDDERLASPSFERLAAGVEIAGDTIFGAALPSSAAIICPITYETFLVDTLDGLPRQEELPATPFPHDRLTALLFDGAAGRSSLARAGSQLYVGPRRATMPADVDFVVATSEQLASSSVGAPMGQTYSQARAALDAELARHPERRGQLLIAPRYEVQP